MPLLIAMVVSTTEHSLNAVRRRVFLPQAIREQMRKTTWQTATTDEPKISTLGVDEIPVAVCDTGTIKNLGAHFLRPRI